MVLRELINRFGFDIDEAALNRADKKFDSIKKKFTSVGDAAFKQGKRLTLGVTLPVVGVGAAFIKAASDAEETTAKFDTVFKDIRDESNATSKQLAKDFGLSQVKARELLGDTGDLLTGFGFTQESALELSNEVNKLAVDLASFTNFSGGAEGASKALTKALLGERESIKSLGISILEEDVKRQVQINSANGMTFATERQAKAFATLQLAQKQSQNAIGDFARTSDGFANQLRIAQGELLDLSVSFGKILLPTALKFLKVARRVIQFFDALPEGIKTNIIIIGGLAAILGPLLIVFGAVVNAIGVLIPIAGKAALVFKALGTASIFAQAKMLLIPIAIGAAVLALVAFVEDLVGFFQGKDSVVGRAFIFLEGLFTDLSMKFENLGGVGKTAIQLILTPLRSLVALFRTASSLVQTIFGNKSFREFFRDAKTNFGNAFNPSQFASGSLSGALGLGANAGNPLTGLAAQARQNQARGAGGQTVITQEAKLDVNVTGLPPEQAEAATRAGTENALGNLLRDTARAARPAQER